MAKNNIKPNYIIKNDVVNVRDSHHFIQYVYGDDCAQTVERLKAQIEVLKNEIELLKTNIIELEVEKQELKNRINELAVENYNLEKENKKLQNELNLYREMELGRKIAMQQQCQNEYLRKQAFYRSFCDCC